MLAASVAAGEGKPENISSFPGKAPETGSSGCNNRDYHKKACRQQQYDPALANNHTAVNNVIIKVHLLDFKPLEGMCGKSKRKA